MQRGIGDCKSFRPSDCQKCELWQSERYFCPNSYTVWKTDASSFPTRRMVGGGGLMVWLFGQCDKWRHLANGNEKSHGPYLRCAAKKMQSDSFLENYGRNARPRSWIGHYPITKVAGMCLSSTIRPPKSVRWSEITAITPFKVSVTDFGSKILLAPLCGRFRFGFSPGYHCWNLNV